MYNPETQDTERRQTKHIKEHWKNEEHGHHQNRRGEFRCPGFRVVVNSALTLLLGYDAYGFR
jgi:hypothetical protein